MSQFYVVLMSAQAQPVDNQMQDFDERPAAIQYANAQNQTIIQSYPNTEAWVADTEACQWQVLTAHEVKVKYPALLTVYA